MDAKGYTEQFLGGGNISQNSSCIATYLPSLKPSKIRRTRQARYYWISNDELRGDVLLWTSSHGLRVLDD